MLELRRAETLMEQLDARFKGDDFQATLEKLEQPSGPHHAVVTALLETQDAARRNDLILVGRHIEENTAIELGVETGPTGTRLEFR
jgi:hypothetical protein